MGIFQNNFHESLDMSAQSQGSCADRNVNISIVHYMALELAIGGA
jgi:hypothetical protein